MWIVAAIGLVTVGVSVARLAGMRRLLRECKERFGRLFEGVPVGVCLVGPDGAILSANRSLARFLGYEDETLLRGMHEAQLYATWPLPPAIIGDDVGAETALEVLCRRRDGTAVWARETRRPILGPDGSLLYSQRALEDLTLQKSEESAERVLQHQFRRLVDPSVVGTFVVQDERVVFTDQKFETNFGFGSGPANSPVSLVDALVVEDDRARVSQVLRRIQSGRDTELARFRAHRTDGVELDVEAQVSPAEFAGARAVIGTLVDVARRKQIEQKLNSTALQDSLTGLANRVLFLERLEHALKRRKRGDYPLHFAVLFLDLDRFKAINDRFGHQVGDELLVEIAGRLQLCVRPADTVARLGGDEFALLLEDVHDIADATRVADRIAADIARPISLQGYEVMTAASIGVVLSAPGLERPEHLLQSADMAMYRAKAAGRGRYEVFDRAMHAQAMARLRLESDLRRALERSEFRLYYQPILELSTGRLRGFEALVHWHHPERGLLGPSEFIPLAEETGLIIQLSAWVLREACRQVRVWHDRFAGEIPLTMSINLSARQLLKPDLADEIQDVMREMGLRAEHLRFDITETSIMADVEAASDALSRMRAIGLQLCLDDFGTGSSSLSHLHTLPLDTLKIDCSLVGRLGEDHPDSHLVRTIVNVARDLQLHVVSEGVETRQHLEALRQLECDMGQGYLFSRPVDARGAEALLTRNPPWLEHWGPEADDPVIPQPA